MLRTLLLATAVAAFAAPAYARPGDDPQEPPYEVVQYSDLNLKYEGDAERLVDRIQEASNQVCNRREGRQAPMQRADNNRCGRVAARQAVADVGHPNVSAEYYGYRPEVVIEDDGSPKK